MIIRKGFRYRQKVRKQNLIALGSIAGCQRYVWNHFLALQKALLEDKKSCLSYAQMCKELTQMKKREESAFLKEPPSQTLQQTLKDLDRALREAFGKRRNFPASRSEV